MSGSLFQPKLRLRPSSTPASMRIERASPLQLIALVASPAILAGLCPSEGAGSGGARLLAATVLDC